MKRFHSSILMGAMALAAASCAAAGGERREFEVRNAFEVEVPAGAGTTRAWFALPDDRDPAQSVGEVAISANGPAGPVPTRITRDEIGNRFLYLEYSGGPGKLEVVTEFALTRAEERKAVPASRTRPLTGAERTRMAEHLGANEHVQITPAIAARAKAAVGAEANPIRMARLIYDDVLDGVTYWVKFPDVMKASPVGSAVYTQEMKCGNCTDFHSLYAAMTRAVGIPTRMVYGSFLKGPLDGKDTDQSYHCWIEFWAPDVGWIPLDVAVADVYVDDFVFKESNASKVELTTADGYAGPDPGLVDYYFGNLEARRVTWNRGRDLTLAPAAADGPVNAMPKGHVEVDGKEWAKWTRKCTFREVGAD
jgi:transglutaminase-like putative cysteine protease